MRFFFTSFLAVFAICCKQKTEPGAANEMLSPAHLAKDIIVLASDEFEGRKPFTNGETKTINYLKNGFKTLGLEAGNGTNWFQEVPMINIISDADSIMELTSSKETFFLKAPDDYVIWTQKTDSLINIKNTQVVFAGYGTVAPEYNWNDYAGIDVKGTIVLVMAGEPQPLDNKPLFKGDTLTYYGRWTYKIEEAARQGAAACFILHNAAAGFNFERLHDSWKAARLRLDDRENPAEYCSAVGWLSEIATQKLMKAGGLDSTLFTKANQQGFQALPLNLHVSTTIKTKVSYNKTNNVIAKITGTKFPDEYIIYTAHWDHLGIGKPDVHGDSIYNGAIDNASGTAGLLQLARMFQQAKKKPERTIIFLAVTAEEQGLWGSAYYAFHPIYQLSKTLANINMDGLNTIGRTRDITIVGQTQSELESYLQEEAKKVNRYLVYDKSPGAGHYFRSDHFNFAKAGVPAIYAGSGTEVIGEKKNYGLEWKANYGSKNYHQPSDHYDPTTWRLDGAMEDLKILYRLGMRLASIKKWPEWNVNSEFKSTREKSLHQNKN